MRRTRNNTLGLCLKRKVSEQIIIGDDIVVTVIEVKGGYVKLAINAPRETPVHRKEVHDAMKDEPEKTESRRGNMGDGSGASPRWARNGGE